MKEIRIRPAGSGRDGTGHPFLRSVSLPKAALLVVTNADLPGDWNAAPADGQTEAELGHALGWTLEVQREDLLLINPLGEGLIRMDLPTLQLDWERSVRQDGSCAMFLRTAADSLDGRAATVRTAFSDDYGKTEAVGRNQRCPCDSGKKYKHCCGS